MRRYQICVTALLAAMAVLTGCGKGENTSVEELPPVDWKTEGFAVSGAVEEKQEYWVQKYIPWERDGVKLDAETEELYLGDISSLTCANDGSFYRLSAVIRPPYAQAVRWILESYDTETMETNVREVSYEELGQKKEGSSFLVAMDAMAEDSFVFHWIEVERNAEGLVHQTVSRMIYTAPEGEAYAVDLWETYLDKGIAEETFEENMVIPLGYCVCDGAGNTYAKAGETKYGYSGLYVFDWEGNILLEYRGRPEQMLEEPLRMESGELVYPIYDVNEKCYYFLWPDTEKQEMRTLAKLEGTKRISRMFCIRGNDIYYETVDGIVRWNIGNGSRTLVLNYRDGGIASAFETMLVFREEQPPVLRLYGNISGRQEDWLVLLSPEELPGEEAVRVADLVGSAPGSRQVTECASLTTRLDPNLSFDCKSSVGDAETLRTQVMAELVAGGGPDILYVSRADMKILQEKDLLLDLRELIPRETLEDLLPGVIEMGSIDGKLVGLAPNVCAEGMVVSPDTWSGGAWSLEDMLELMEGGRLESAIYFPSGTRCAPLATVRILTDMSLENSFLIDWEKRESHFEDERFIRLLEITNRNRTASDGDAEDVLEGKRAVLVSWSAVGSISEFCAYADRKGGRFVGLPTEGACGNYLSTDGMLVVNANTKKPEEVRKYLECLLEEEIQELPGFTFSPALGVRRIPLEEIEETPEGGYQWRGMELAVMQDGTTSLHRTEAFLESCVPGPGEHPELSCIIYEELEAMYAGNKSPRQTAEIIDSRIQLYLDEGN